MAMWTKETLPKKELNSVDGLDDYMLNETK